MPTYAYVCDACGHSFEEFQPITAKPLKTCPRCRRRSIKRIIQGGAGLIFKGSGFYITDHRSKNYQDAAKKESDAAAPKEPAPKEPAPKQNTDPPASADKREKK